MGAFLDYTKNKNKKKDDEEKVVSSNNGGGFATYAKGKRLGLDTLSDELNTMNSTINSMMGGWQTAETMANTKASVQSMVDRLSGNEDFIKQHSGFDISPLLGEYSKILEGWDERTALYGHYANSDAFDKAVKNAKLEKQFEGLSYGDVQARMRRYAPDSDEYNYLKNYTGYSSKEDFDKAMEEMAKAVNPIEEKAQEYEAEIKQIESNKQTAVSRSRGAGGIAEFMDEKIDKKSKEYDDYLTSQGYDRETLDERLDYQRELEKAKNRYLLDVGVADEYKHLEGKDDFAKYSQYDASVNKGKDIMNDFLTYDHEYDYINNIGDVRNINKTMAVMAGSADNGYYSDGYDQLRENEVAYYNYLSYWDRQNGTKNAKKFLKEMKPALQKRVSDRNAVNREALLKNPVIATAYTLTSPIATVAGGIGNIASSVIETVSGSGYNAYSPLREISNANTHARGVVAGNIAEATEGFEVFGQNIPSFLYQTGGSMLDSTVGMLTTGGASVVLMGANAYQQKAKELTEQGFDEGTVQANAIMSGALEVAFEKIGFDNLMKMKDADSIRNVLKSAFKSQGIVEGLEELGTAGGNILADIMFQGKDSQYIKMYNDLLERGYDEKYASGKVALAITSELGWSTVGGYLSGVGMGGSMSAMQYGANKATGADLRAGEQISGVFDLANNPEMAQAYEAYTRYANEGITEENITDAQLGNLYNTATADAQQGFDSANKDLAKAKKTIEKQKAIRENEYWSDGIRNRATEKLDKAIAKQTEAQQKRVANAEVLEKIGGINTAVARTKIQKAVEKKKEADREKRKAEIAELSSGVEVSAVAETGKAIDIKGIKVDKGETTIVTSDGDIALDKVELSDRDAALIRFAKGADSQAEAQLFLDTYDENINTDLEAYENDFTLVNAYAKSGGFSEDYILEHKGSLSAEQVSNIYKETIIKQTLKKEADLTKLIANTANNAPYKGYIDDSIIDYKNKSTEGKVNWNKLNSRQKQSVEFLKVFATKAGMNLVFEGYSDTMNGAFNIVDNTIHVSLNAGITETHLTDTIIPTASHEITHWMEEKSPELYNKLATMVLDALSADGISREARIRAEIARLDKSHPDKKHDERDAVNEIVAKACEDMLAMSKEGRKLFESMTEEEQKTFVGKIKEIIANLKKWIDEFLSSYKADSEEAKALRNYKEKLVEISKVWDEMLVRSIEVNQAMEKADIFGNLKNGISADGTTIVGKNKLQMSDKTYRDGGRDFLIKWLDGQKDISKADKQNIIEQTDRVAAIMRAIDEGGEIPEYSRWANLEVVKDENGDKVLSVIVKNGDYAMNIDFSQVCKKRVALNAVLNKMVQAGDLNVITLTETDVADLNAIIKSHDFEIACALCFVDSKRYRVGSWAESFCEGSDEKKSGKKVHKYGFNEMVRSLIPKGSGINVDEFNFTNRDIKNQPTENLLSEADDSQLDFSLIDSIIENNDAKSAQHRYAKAIKENPEIRKILNSAEIISSIGLDAIRLESPKLYGLINGHQGTAKPKFSHDVVAYGNDVIKASNFTPERAKMVGGVRCQSFSDFMAVMVVDYAQFISELAAKKLTAHSYTKEPLFVKLFGLTGMKINMSLVPKAINMTPEQQEKFAILKDESVSKKSKAYKTAYEEYMKLTENAGLDDNGNYIWEDETFPYDIAMEIVVDKRYSKNCGTIAVGISNNHIKKLLADPTISMVIPYHKSGLNHEVAMMRDIALYRDYTEYQNTRDKKTGKKLEKGQADFDFYGDLYGVDGKEGTHDPKQTAENYKKWCYEHNYSPKFDEFMLDENYYKLLIDFRVYDVDGTYVEQQPVQTIYPDNAEFEDLILNGVTDKNGKVYGGLIQQQANTDRLDSESQQIVDEYKQMLKEKHGYQFSEKGFEFTKDDYKQNCKELVHMNSVAKLVGTELDGNLPLREKISDLFKSWGSAINTERFGRVDLTESSIRSDIRHGTTRNKVTAYAAIPHVLNNGVVIDVYKKNRGEIERIIIAAPITISNTPYFMGVMIQKAENSNRLYLHDVVIKKEVSEYQAKHLNTTGSVDTENLFITEMLEKAISDGYILSSFDNKSNDGIVNNEKKQYSDKNSSSVYDVMGEKNRLLKENEAFKDEVERLKEALKLEKQVTHGNHFNENQLTSVAKHLLKISNSEYSGKSLIAELKDIYSYIAQSKELTWEDLFSKCYEVARKMLGKENPDVAMNDFFKELGMREVSEAYAEYESEEQTRWLANEIYNQYWNVSSIKTTADKYDKQMQMLKWKHRQAMDKLRSEYKERAEQKAKSAKLLEQMYYGKKLLEKDKEIARQKLADDMYYGKIIHNLQVKREQEADRLKAYGKERLDSFKERAEKKARIQSITGNARILNEMLVKNSKDKHIPEAMKPVVEELLQAIDFSSKRLLEGGEATQRDIALDKVFGHLKDMITDEVKEVGGVLDEMYGSGIDELTRELVKSVDDSMKDIEGNVFTLNEMSVEDLKKLDTIIKVMKQAVNRVNKFHIAQYNAGVMALGVKSTSEIDTRKKLFKDNKKHFEKLKTHVFWNNLNPYYAFKHLGEASQKIFTALQDGQDKLAFLSREVIDFAKGAYTEAEYKKWKDTFFDFEIPKQDGSTAKFSMNVPQIMSLYCLVKQEDARKHILFGDENGEGKGITIVETEKTEAVRRNIRLTEANLKSIIDKLNETDKVGRAKEVADKLQEYMGTRGAELGNEISMARWGIKSFGIKDYFPIKVSDGSVPKKNDTPGIESTSMLEILNMSFTKSRNHFAKQSVEIGDIMDVFANHMSNMVRYNAMALPILDMYKWINCRGEDAFGNEFSLQTSIKDTFGDHAWSYFNTFLKDISGGTKKSTRDKLAVKFFKNAKVAKVAGNLRVALLQFTSFVRAGAVIDNKYLMKALGHKPKIKMAEEKCGIAQWKSQGYYDTDITRGLSDQIKHTTGVKDKIVDWSLKGAEWGDKITWGYLWTACELEIRDKRKDLTVGSDEFYKAINERLRDVIYRTQVVDSMLTRSQMMRSPDTWDKVLTMFGSESALSFNMAMDVFVGYELDKRSMGKKAAKEKNRKYRRKAITAFVATNVVTTILQSVFDAFRDYDEEDKDEEYWTKLMLTNFLSNTSVLNKLPYISNISSILQGFTPSRVDTDWMVSAVKAGKEMYKLFTGEGSTEKAIKNALKVLSDSTGIAAYNVYRDIQSMYELFDD